MFAVTLLAFGLVESSICQEKDVLNIFAAGELQCEGFRSCFDGCNLCSGNTVPTCEVTVAQAQGDKTCACDFLHCFSYCAKAKCDEAIFPAAVEGCVAQHGGWVLQGVIDPAACRASATCTSAWMMSATVPLVLLALFQ